MLRPRPIGHPVIILARGHGSRLAVVARGRHKTMEPVAGSPILGRILHELEAVQPTALYLHLREADDAADRLASAHPQCVEISAKMPSGYLPDVVDCARYGDRFTVVEADTITHPGSLRNFLILADQLVSDADLCMGVAPLASNPNGPAVIVDHDGYVKAVHWAAEPSGLVPLGAWHWTRSMLADADMFASRSTSIADYISWSIPRGARVIPIGFPAGRNVNTPTDLNEAGDQVAAWSVLRGRRMAA